MRFVIIFIISLLAFPVYAHDHNHPEWDEWYNKLKSKGNSSCCDGSDAVSVPDPDWEPQNKEGSHFRVKIDISIRADTKDIEWVDVPDDAVVSTPNITGVAKVWPFIASPYGGPSKVMIRCFMPGVLY